MKNIILLLFVLVPILAFSQAKKPTIMVVPSDSYCIHKGYYTKDKSSGTERLIPDYKRTLQSEQQIRLVITKMAAIMADRGFPLKDLEQELKNIDTEAAEIALLESSSSGASIKESPIDVLKRVAKADIILNLDISTKRNGPENYVVFNLRALDAYTNKQIAGAAGQGLPSSSAAPEILLEEAVLSHMDNFNGRLMKHFKDMFANGRESKIMIRVWDNSEIDLDSEFEVEDEEMSLADAIELWCVDNCVKGRFSNSDASSNLMKLEQVRVPLFYKRKGRQVAMGTKKFVNNLRKYLKKAPFNIESKVYQKGLGEAWLIIGEK